MYISDRAKEMLIKPRINTTPGSPICMGAVTKQLPQQLCWHLEWLGFGMQPSNPQNSPANMFSFLTTNLVKPHSS